MLWSIRFLICCAMLCAAPALVMAAPTATTEHAELSLTIERTAEESWARIDYTLAPDWHIYWRNPGDSGLETQISWTLPEGMSAGDLRWPLPKRIDYGELFNYGYEDEVSLLVPVKAEDAEAGAEVSAKVDFLICHDICIPESATLTAELPEVAGTLSSAMHRAVSKLPQPFTGRAEYDLVGEDRVHFGIDLTRSDIEVRRIFDAQWYPIDAQVIANSDSQEWRLVPGTLIVSARREGSATPDPFRGVLYVATTDGARHVLDVKAAFSPLSTGATEKTGADNVGIETPELVSGAEGTFGRASDETIETTLFAALIGAFIGGIILNIMPCVLPVLSLKALSIAKKSGRQRKHIRKEGLAYTAGVVLSFLVVAGVLIVLQQAGHAVGWGFQLQSPGFVLVLIYLLFIIGLNLFGMFDLPSHFAGMGQKYADLSGPAGAFFTGVLATIVATPCVAPFMATAIGYALAQSAFAALLIFAMLGLGLAFPLLLITFVPAASHLLPKPGAWMHRFKQALAFPMFATVIWLLWVLTQQTGSMGLLLALIGLLIIGFVLWMAGLVETVWAKAAWLVAATLALLWIGAAETTPAAQHNLTPAEGIEAFSQTRIDALRAEGRAVFVNATADWCITCKMNERSTLQDSAVVEAMRAQNIAYLKADWTRRDDAITRYLQSFGRSGVPMYVYYAPGKDPVLLPQILTPGIVLEALQSNPDQGDDS